MSTKKTKWIEFEDNSGITKDELANAVKQTLTAWGMTAETHAKNVLTETVYTGKKPWKLTGRLRNSITFAVGGENANISSYGTDTGDEGGVYSGKAPKEKKPYVAIGTNVVYAAGIELGTHRKAGAVHFLKHAVTEHKEEYAKILQAALKAAKGK